MTKQDIVFWTVISFYAIGVYLMIMTTLCFALLISIGRFLNKKGGYEVDVKAKTDMLRTSKEALNAIKAEDLKRFGR